MKLSIQVGSTSQSVNVFVRDSSSTTGGGLTGLVFNSAGLTAYCCVPGSAPNAVTLATLAANNSAWSSGGFKEIDSANMPGWYRFDVPNLCLSTGRCVSYLLKGAANMAPLPLEIELTAWNNQDATSGGLSRIDAAISTRSTYAGADTAGTTTLLARVPGTIQPQTGDSYARLGAPVGASISADVASVAAGVWAVGTRTLTSFGTLVADIATAVWGAATRSLTDKAGFSLAVAPPTAATIATTIVDQTLAGHTTAGTVGGALNSASSAGDPWGTALPGAYGAGTAGAIVAAIPSANANADALLDRADGIESGWTFRKALRIIAAACAGKLSGAATATATIRNITDTKDRITATTDADGNRTAVTLDGA